MVNVLKNLEIVQNKIGCKKKKPGNVASDSQQ